VDRAAKKECSLFRGPVSIEVSIMLFAPRPDLPEEPSPEAAVDPLTDAAEPWPEPSLGRLVGRSLVMRRLFGQLVRIAASEATVLVTGETGTGKELVARTLHERSARAGGPFVTVDCGAIAPTLLEAELFGHARGAFTDARSARPGAIEAAEGGTVFLDEIGELPLAMQPKLLRVLESRTVKRLGETHHRPVDVRFVFATHRRLRRMVVRGEFREDLYFRVAVLWMRVPALRERLEDVPDLIERLCPADARPLVTPALVETLARRGWPGNVRELRNTLERLAVLGPGLDPDGEPAGGEADPPAALVDPVAAATDRWGTLPYKAFRAAALQDLERAYLVRLLARHQQRISAAAAGAQINRTYLHRLLRRHNLRGSGSDR
jgi:two-component system response regulator GlrR